MKKKSGRIVFCVAVLIVFLLMAAVLELSKNTLPGFILLAIVTCCFAFVFVKKLSGGKVSFKVLGWLCFVLLFAVILIATKPPVKAIPAADYKNIVRTDIVETEKGQVRGVLSEDGEIEIYAGIPYAKPPVGPLRWKEPVSPEAWEGVLEADTFAPMSMQPTNLPIYDSLSQIIGYHDYKISLKDNFVAPVSEDSLYLNIWKPAGEVEDLPVLVYIHGGSLQTGQPWYEDYSGQGLAREGVIVVNMGYRLGVFGFLADEDLAAESANDTTGNYGLLDQIKALEWVRDNIAAFGGDPENVTLSGESAGSACVSALCTSPLAKGLFKRVLLESSTVTAVSPTHSFRLLPEALESGKELKERYNAQYINDLRKIDAKKLVKEADTQHHMTVDGYVLEKTPHEAYLAGEFNEEKIIHGYNLHEGEAFILFDQANLSNYEKKVRDYFGELADEVFEIYPITTGDEVKAYWEEIYSAVFFDYPHYCLNRLAVVNEIPVYQYYFVKDNGRLGNWHSGEEVYLYGNIPEGSKLYDETDRVLSDVMKGYFANYIKTGDPNGEGLPLWTENLNSSDVMEFGDYIGMASERKHALFDVLDKMQGWDLN
ncbi:MAG: carboxylesterase family protein [Lachnospiraceae bacterium]|nr:carboxylesterase family protein [Lachnospiraceae bacterium]